MAKRRESATSAKIPADAVERIQASNRAWHRRDIDGAVAPYSDQIEWDTRDAFPDGRLYRGADAFRAYCEEVLDRWSNEHRLEIEEILGVEGTATVVVRFRMTGRSQSGVPIDTPWVHVLDFDRGEIVRARNFGSFDAAMECVGPANTALAGRLRLIRTALNEALALVSKQVFNGTSGTVIEPSSRS